MESGGHTNVTLRKNDAEALTRADVQYDLLHVLFDETSTVFTDHTPHYQPHVRFPAPLPRVTFRTLYIGALIHSTKLSGVVKDRMINDVDFALEFAKLALLVNVGRINTTMAFFPDMKTALRTYNPVPSLQKTEGNAQDAPRIKSALKGAFFPAERNERAHTLGDLRRRTETLGAPPTSVTNLFFILAAHLDAAIAGPDGPLSFSGLFTPTYTQTVTRARGILWLTFHYLEGPGVANPFGPPDAPAPPPLLPATPDEIYGTNRDTPEELDWAARMRTRRALFLQDLVQEEHPEPLPLAPPPPPPPPVEHVVKKRRHEPARTASHSHVDANRRARAEGYVREPLWATTGVAPVPRPPSVEHVPPPPPPPAPPSRPSMLTYALDMNHHTDPATVSDGEDDTLDTRYDYEQRLVVLNRLCARPPSPQTNITPIYR